MRTVLVGAAALALLAGCVSDTPEPGPTAAAVLSVAGEYATEVKLTENTCPGITVQPNPTTVAHRPGSIDVAVMHAGQTYAGKIESNGAFTLTPRSLDVGGGIVHTLAINGRFTTTGFTATVSATVTTNGASPCGYTVMWTGTKDGPPNTLG